MLLLSLVFVGCAPESGHLRLSRPVPTPKPEAPPPKLWLRIDSKAQTLSVLRDRETLKVFENVAFGSGGVGDKVRRGDQVTPTGRFTVGWWRASTHFHRFFGLVYPRIEDLERAEMQSRISRSEAASIRGALRRNRIPPQNTILGGYIGIHGVGKGDVIVHRALDWTNGCVALENHQIDELSNWMFLGMVVEIQ